jgi:hypothetical protein
VKTRSGPHTSLAAPPVRSRRCVESFKRRSLDGAKGCGFGRPRWSTGNAIDRTVRPPTDGGLFGRSAGPHSAREVHRRSECGLAARFAGQLKAVRESQQNRFAPCRSKKGKADGQSVDETGWNRNMRISTDACWNRARAGEAISGYPIRQERWRQRRSDDRAGFASGTRDFMVKFYSKLAAGQTKGDAWIETQRELIRGGVAPHLWAPFVLYGDPGPLAGK